MLSKRYLIISSILGASLLTGSSFHFLSKREILIESEESKNAEMKSVFNKIKWISLPDKDVWMMNQSHYGLHAEKHKWERLAIVIDKTKRPLTAKYYQISPGPLEWSDDLPLKKVSYRASCFTCHSNGPRAIRPLNGDAALKMNVKDKTQIFLMNLKIKTYGRIHYDKTHDSEDLTLETPFRHNDQGMNDELKVKTCLHCHKEDGLFSRGALRRQQIGTIANLVEKGHMPPPGFSLSAKEKKELWDFMRGFP